MIHSIYIEITIKISESITCIREEPVEEGLQSSDLVRVSCDGQRSIEEFRRRMVVGRRNTADE